VKRIVVVVALIAVLAGGFGVWWFLIRDDAPPEAALVDRDVAEDPSSTDSADGTWSVSEDEESFGGFRIVEHFSGGIDNTAVVRSPAVAGSLVVDGTTVDEVSMEVDLTALESQDSVPPGVPGIGNRVDQMRRDGLEIDTFPTATFELTEPITLAGSPVLGEAIATEAVGELTVHGVSRPVTIPIEARWNGDVIDVAGSLEVVLADHGMDAPERPFVTVDDVGTMEFQLVLERAD
jgi:polyisoprenoid-binding protein YceI